MSKTILIAPLNWGLGHATRCIPIINACLEKKHTVIVASDGVALALLQKEFPKLITETLPSYHISYPEKGNFVIQMAKLVPGILEAIKLERMALEKLILKHQIDVVISDNRYGMYNASVKSIYLTHQIKVAAPFGEDLLAKLQQNFLKHFDETWIPDVAETVNLSGKLGHNANVPKNATYIGGLSRFSGVVQPPKIEAENGKEYLIAVISGPEPQRSAFEKLLVLQLTKLNMNSVIVGGNPSGKTIKTNGKLRYFNFVEAENLRLLLNNASVIISRSGYSTIMDLAALEKKAILIPTPGQTEQEYLADYLHDSGMFYSVSQNEFDVEKAISEVKKLPVNSIFRAQDFFKDLAPIINTI